VKFGAFLKKALEMGADYIATGHYTQNLNQNLVKSIDSKKDQSYFLWTLKQDQLKHILFPIGHLTKTEVRVLAKKYKIPVAEKKDSQGICFLGQVDLKDFLKHYIKDKKGVVVNEKREIIGSHDGAVFYTLGERHGFNITKKTSNDARYYVVDKDIKKNILIVSNDKNYSVIKNTLESNTEKEIILNNINWISEIPEENKTYTVQIRYHGEFLKCKIISLNKEDIKVIFEKNIKVAKGQSLVFYNKDLVLGGGVVL
jgi:tRNA-specific 2-thiouridylase